MFSHVADAASVRNRNDVLFAAQRISPERSFKATIKHQTQTVLSLQ